MSVRDLSWRHGAGQPAEATSAPTGPPNPQAGVPGPARAARRAYRADIMRDRYLLTEQVGAGGMGTVWRAWDRHERRWVAAKLLGHGPGRHDAAAFERFVREQGLRVRHRHVLQPADCVVDRSRAGGSRSLFTMDLVRGGSLDQLLARHGPLPGDYVRVVLEQVLEALVAVHAAGVVHRDVKPGNLLLEPTGTGRPWVRLGDFGVAVSVGDARLTRVPGGVGTGGYLAPEQAAGAAPDPRQDLYAAGVVALEALTGLPPGDAAASPPDGPFGRLLARLTDPAPAGRPQTAAEALGQLRGLGVPAGAPWQTEPRPPDVVDLFGDRGTATPGGVRRFATYARFATNAWAVPAVFAGSGLVGSAAAWLVLR